MAFRNLWSKPREIRALLKKPDIVWVRRQPKANLTPGAGGFGSLFKLQTILDHIECAPVIIISAFPLIALLTHIIRRFMTVEDIKFTPKSKMRCERHRYIIQGGKPPIHKYMVINQKYEWPPGLLRALSEEDCCEKKKTKRICFNFWSKDQD